MPKKLLLAIAIILIFLFSIALYFLIKIQRTQQSYRPASENAGKIVETTISEGSPIIKTIPVKGTGVTYRLQGSFSSNFTDVEGREGKTISAPFILKNDPLKREITVNLGPEGTAMLGLYNGDFSGSASWKVVSLSDLENSISPGQEVEVLVEYIFLGTTVGDYAVQTQEVFDTIDKEYSTGKFAYSIPEGFFVLAAGVGKVELQ